MTRTTKITTIVCSAAFTLGTAGIIAQVNGYRHPNLAAAQQLTGQAINRISMAQRANEFDMNGHAAHAKQLLEQAQQELNIAAGAANRN